MTSSANLWQAENDVDQNGDIKNEVIKYDEIDERQVKQRHNQQQEPQQNDNEIWNELSNYWDSKMTNLLITLKLSVDCKNVGAGIDKSVRSNSWRTILERLKNHTTMQLTVPEIQKKYQNLLTTYKRNKDKSSDRKITWEFFEIFDNMLGNQSSMKQDQSETQNSASNLWDDTMHCAVTDNQEKRRVSSPLDTAIIQEFHFSNTSDAIEDEIQSKPHKKLKTNPSKYQTRRSDEDSDFPNEQTCNKTLLHAQKLDFEERKMKIEEARLALDNRKLDVEERKVKIIENLVKFMNNLIEK